MFAKIELDPGIPNVTLIAALDTWMAVDAFINLR